MADIGHLASVQQTQGFGIHVHDTWHKPSV